MDKYLYSCKVLDVYDADTMTLLIDVGFSIHIKEKCRLMGVDTPEIRTRNAKEKKFGLEARDFVRELILGKDVEIQTYKKGKFGRYLIDLFIEGYVDNSVTLNSVLVDRGYAKIYDGGKREKWFV